MGGGSEQIIEVTTSGNLVAITDLNSPTLLGGILPFRDAEGLSVDSLTDKLHVALNDNWNIHGSTRSTSGRIHDAEVSELWQLVLLEQFQRSRYRLTGLGFIVDRGTLIDRLNSYTSMVQL